MLTRATRWASSSRFAQLTAVLLISTLLQSCSNETAATDASPAAGLSDLPGQLLEALSEGAQPFSPPGEPRLPEDLSAHSRTQLESFSLEALLFSGDETRARSVAPVAALIAQIDRFALQPDDMEGAVESQWRYNGIMRSRVFTDAVTSEAELAENIDTAQLAPLRALGQLQLQESVQRMALDLAGSTSHALWVGGDRVNIVLGADVAQCERSYQWESVLSSSQRLVLNIRIASCPSVSSLGELNTWAQAAVEISGVLTTQPPQGEPTDTVVTGVGWFRQSWGNVPSGGGAVVIDTLALVLDENRTLDVSRSRRRSGRGPKTVSAIFHTRGQASINVNLTWIDSAEQLLGASGAAYPQHITLRSDDESLLIKAIIMNRLSESSIGSDVRAHVPVVVSGTHQGAGFLSLTALPTEQGDQAGI